MAASGLLLAGLVHGADDVLRLPVGDPERRDQASAVVLDAITDTRTGDLLSPDQLAKRLADKRILFVGEEHTNIDFHRAQARIIRALHEAGRPVVIALEMFPYTSNEILSRWSDGQLSDRQFLRQVEWNRHWGYRWEYYRAIFWYARNHGLAMAGINAPRDVIRAVRTDGFGDLPEADRKHLPASVDTDSADYERLFRAYFGADDSVHAAIGSEQWRGMFRAQCTWDAVMGWNALGALDGRGGDAIVVALLGTGHVAYGLGAERQISDRLPGGIASLLPLSVADGRGNRVATVQSSYADYVWGVPPAREPLYPTLGVSLAGRFGDEAGRIIQVGAGTVGGRAGFRVGDIVLGMNGTAFTTAENFRALINELRWGDIADFDIRRGEQVMALTVVFRRSTGPAEPEPAR